MLMTDKHTSGTVDVLDADSESRVSIQRSAEQTPFLVTTHTSMASLRAPRPSTYRDLPGCLLVNFRTSKSDVASLIASLTQRFARSPIIFYDRKPEASKVASSLQNGAFDFLEWPSDVDTLPLRVRKAVDAAQVRHDLRRQLESVWERIGRLTKREREVMHLVSDGNANKVVSSELGISERTVEVHRANAMRKLGARSLPQMVSFELVARCFTDHTQTPFEGLNPSLRPLLEAIPPDEDLACDRNVA